MSEPVKVSRVLLSVSDKSGIVEFASKLRELNVELLSTGGTYRLLQESGLEVTEVSDYTGFPEMMDGQNIAPQSTRRHSGPPWPG